jgi:hypothetical protein
MRKIIFSVVMTMLVGACWVAAQNGAINQWTTPYGQQRVPGPRPEPGNEPVVVGATQLDVPPIPPAPPTPSTTEISMPAPLVTVPTLPTPVPVATPTTPAIQVVGATTEPAVVPPMTSEPPTTAQPAPGPFATPLPPPSQLSNGGLPSQRMDVQLPSDVATTPANPPLPPVAPAQPAASAAPMGPPAAPATPPPPAPSSDVPPAPIVTPPAPVQAAPPQPPKQSARSTTQPAIGIIPPLPPVPGVPAAANGYPYAQMTSQGAAANPPPMSAMAVPYAVGPAPTGLTSAPSATNQPPLAGAPAPSATTPPTWTVDNPAGAPSVFDGQEVINGPVRVLGPRVWLNAEYLFWFIKPQSAPPLAQAVTGVQPGDTNYSASQVVNLFPPSSGDTNTINGVRGTFGFWLDSAQTLGFESSYFWMGQSGANDLYLSNSSVLLGRPFINANTGLNMLYQVSSLDGVNGAIRVSSTFHAEGGDANFLLNSFGYGFSFLGGFRYLSVNEGLNINSSSINANNGFAAQSYDSFATSNQFYGGQLGLRWNYDGPRLLVSLTAKIAYGEIEERVRINGGTAGQDAGGAFNFPGGVLAQTSNIGAYNHNTTTFIPEANATIGYRMASWATAFIGYNFMYVNNLVRPGHEINPVVSPENLPFQAGGAGAQPAFPGFKQQSLWLQGANVGLSFQY